MKRRVVLINEGSWGSVSPESYRRLLESIRNSMKMLKSPDGKNDLAEAEICELKEAEKKIKEGETVDFLIFNSRGMLDVARRIKKEYPRLKVVVLTGLLPEEEVILIDKNWISGEFLQNLLSF